MSNELLNQENTTNYDSIERVNVEKEPFAKRHRLKAIIGLGFIIILGMQLLFMPRTSLSRDYRRFHFGTVTKWDSFRWYLQELTRNDTTQNHISAYANNPLSADEYTYNTLYSYGLYTGNQNGTVQARIAGITGNEIVLVSPEQDATAMATLLEIAKGFGHLQNRGWVPLRSVKFVFGNVTAAAQDVVIINVDGVKGDQFDVHGHPMLEEAIVFTSKSVADGTTTLYHKWKKHGIDIKPPKYHNGIPSASFKFTGNGEVSGTTLHNLLARYVGLLSLQFIEHEVVFYSVSRYIEFIRQKTGVFNSNVLDLAEEFDQYASDLHDQVTWDYPWYQAYKKLVLLFNVKKTNFQMMKIDHQFMVNGSHVVFDHKSESEIVSSLEKVELLLSP